MLHHYTKCPMTGCNRYARITGHTYGQLCGRLKRIYTLECSCSPGYTSMLYYNALQDAPWDNIPGYIRSLILSIRDKVKD